jgi:hypothetical protein
VEAALLIEQSGEEDLERLITSIDVEPGAWTLLNGDFGVGFEGTPDAVSLTISGPDAGIDLCVADAMLQPLTVD